MSLHFLDQTPEPPAIDALIARQAMDPRRQSQSATAKFVRDILNQRCARCGQWLTDEARCLHCGAHQ